MPISTTHSIIGALVGFGIVAGGVSSVNWVSVGSVAASWLLSPIGGYILAFIVFRIIVKLIFAKEKPVKATKIIGPLIIGSTGFVLSISLFFKTQLGLNAWYCRITNNSYCFNIYFINYYYFINFFIA